MARGAVEQAGGVLHRAADENGVDPRPNPHDTAHMGRALHGSGGAVPVVASKQTGPAPQSFSAARVYSRGSPCQVRGTAAASQPKQESRRPPAVDKQPAAARLLAVAAAGYLPTAAPSQLPPANHAATAPRCPMSLKSPSKRGFSSPPTRHHCHVRHHMRRRRARPDSGIGECGHVRSPGCEYGHVTLPARGFALGLLSSPSRICRRRPGS